mmetsp:Transcript_32389/g.102850  ORF Transcript_32389/g.102850 Transcript_32389/m.102850 type:complete len:281 (-) Transcript_32389:24-866(-)
MRPLNFFRPFKLFSKVTLVEGDARSPPVRRFTFELPANTSLSSLGFDLGLGSFVKVSPPRGLARPYSPTSDVNRLGSFDLTVKIYPGGNVSGFLDRLLVGESALCSGPGPVPWIRMCRRGGGIGFGLVAFGVGITEIFEIAKAELTRSACQRVLLLWANRSWSDVFDVETINAVASASGGRLQIIHLLSREQREGCLQGRISVEVLKEAFAPLLDGSLDKAALRFLAVGTRGMKVHTAQCLSELGFTSSAMLLCKSPGLPCRSRRRSVASSASEKPTNYA